MRKHDLQFEEFASDVLRNDDSDYVEVPINGRMFVLVSLGALLVIAVVIGRVSALNIFKGSFYQARAAANVNLQKPIPAHRGIITDRFGEVLARNTETFSVYVNAGELLKDRRQLTLVLTRISEALNEPFEDLESTLQVADYEHRAQVPLVRNISPEQAIAIRGLELSGVTVENDFRREYTDGATFSTVIGYTGTSNESNAVVGKAGLEAYYDEELRGQDGVYVYYRDATGDVLDERVATDAQPGALIETTIDADLQRYFYQRLQQGLRYLGVTSGVGLAIDPRSGEVLAMISLPSYDNNIFMTPGMSQERVALFSNPAHPLFNRAVSGGYNPGSTIKPLVALAALHEGVVAPTYQIFSKGYIEIPNPYVPEKPSRFVDWKPHGWVDVRSALARSSNVYFYEVAGGFEGLKGLGIERLLHYWAKFGLGSPTNIDIDGENVRPLPTPQEKEERTRQPWRIGDTYNVAIGQGDLLVSPVQLLNYIASIAQNGIMYQPHLVRSMTDREPIVAKPVLDYSDWKRELAEVRAGMHDGVVKDYGTSHLLYTVPMSIAAKTGSAQTNNNTKTNAFFVGYGPTEEPQIAILVLIENAKEGSLNAVPIAKDVLEWYYRHRIAPAAAPTP